MKYILNTFVGLKIQMQRD